MLRCAMTAAFAGVQPGAWAQHAYGTLNPPRPIGGLRVVTDRGTVPLADLLRERVTALQLMFTGCTATCPIQGALFAQVQEGLRDAPEGLRLLSVSIDPLGDDAKSVRNWLQRFGAAPARWSAAVSTTQDVNALFDFLQGRDEGADRHTAQVFVFDRQARLTYRSVDIPKASSVVAVMRQVAQKSS